MPVKITPSSREIKHHTQLTQKHKTQSGSHCHYPETPERVGEQGQNHGGHYSDQNGHKWMAGRIKRLAIDEAIQQTGQDQKESEIRDSRKNN